MSRHHDAIPEIDRDEAAVRAANSAYYAAFEALDLDAMSAVWEHSDRVSVTHPGWPMLRGWARVAGSWEAIFANTAYIQFVLTDEVVVVQGDVAWITVAENLLQSSGSADGAAADIGDLSGALVAATNLYTRTDEGWRIAVHHGSPVASPAAPPEAG